ncbi:hypothetical protein JKP88DRAFT_247436 [Tribonema minus]|uniref:Uncharacterized protein n=1 Tax=Tribonema minus TaxID=303371 RepID=A0A836CBH7_9STRA|nr:hypothetical protein JKP88DRAFT_247436 [Tribonema minus]
MDNRYPDETLSRPTNGDTTVYVIGVVQLSAYVRMFDAPGLFKPVAMTFDQALLGTSGTTPDWMRWLLRATYLLNSLGAAMLAAKPQNIVEPNYWDEKVNNYNSFAPFELLIESLFEERLQLRVPVVMAGRPYGETRRRMCAAICASPISMYDALLTYDCIGQPQCGVPFMARYSSIGMSSPEAERWKARDVLRREYHDVFRARSPLLYDAFITEQGMYTAEALQHYVHESGANTVVVVVGVAHQDALERHLCDAHGYRMRPVEDSEFESEQLAPNVWQRLAYWVPRRWRL